MSGGVMRDMAQAACRRRAAAAALMHLNLLLAVMAGVLGVTSARLVWDPTVYVAARELAPAEYSAAAVALPALAALQLCLAHLALLALHLYNAAARRCLLLLYALSMLAVWAVEASVLGWAAARAVGWARGGGAAHAAAVLRDARDLLRPLLRLLARYHLLPDDVDSLFDEVTADVPRNVYLAAALTLLLLVLQLLAAAAALLVRPPPLRPAPALYHNVTSPLVPIHSHGKRRPKAVYRGGRLVLV